MAKCTIDPFTGEIVTISGKLGNMLFKEVYASLRTQLQRDRNGGGTEAERRQVLSEMSKL